MRRVFETNVYRSVRVLAHVYPAPREVRGADRRQCLQRGRLARALADPEGLGGSELPRLRILQGRLTWLTIRYAAAFRPCGSTPSIRASRQPTSTSIEARRPSRGAAVIARYALITSDGPTGGSSIGTQQIGDRCVLRVASGADAGP